MTAQRAAAWIVAVFLVAPAARADELACGEGPHELELAREIKCEDRRPAEVEAPRPTIRPDGTWAYPPSPVILEVRPACEWASFETWSDWPACEGAERIGWRSFDGCNWTTCDEGGACVSTLAACGGFFGSLP